MYTALHIPMAYLQKTRFELKGDLNFQCSVDLLSKEPPQLATTYSTA